MEEMEAEEMKDDEEEVEEEEEEIDLSEQFPIYTNHFPADYFKLMDGSKSDHIPLAAPYLKE